MINKCSTIDKDLCLIRQGNGVVLTKSNSLYNQENQVNNVYSNCSNIYFLDRNSHYVDANELCIESNGFLSLRDAIGRTVNDVASNESAIHILNNDRNTINFNQSRIIEEHFIRKDEFDFHTLTIKFPWYNANAEIIGIFGCSIFLSMNLPSNQNISFAESLSHLIKAGLLNQTAIYQNDLPGIKIGNVYLSKRCKEILRLLVRGKTAKEIAKILFISHRTVENYLYNIKHKLNVSTKSELIDLCINYFK
jgi:DNA-binding CsgD family transcriptional regulator